MKKSALIAFAPAAAAVVIAGCGGGGGGGGGYSKAAPKPSAGAAPTVALAPSRFGNILVDAHGRTLYLFEADKTTASTCYSSCASLWPPLVVSGAAKAGPQVIASQLGTTRRTDGTTEVTYNGHPLYYYVGDKQPGSTAGQGLLEFGALWYVLSPSGNAVTSAPTAPAPAAPAENGGGYGY
jgi:predicted lipoprotein with Yx(FWY)xxD motif